MPYNRYSVNSSPNIHQAHADIIFSRGDTAAAVCAPVNKFQRLSTMYNIYMYNALQRNRIEPKIEKILRKNQNGSRRNRSTTSQILTIRRILEGVRAKNLKATIYTSTSPYTEGRWSRYLSPTVSPKKLSQP